MNIRVALAFVLLVVASLSPAARAETLPGDLLPARSAATIISADGAVQATANASEPRPAMSLIKLYLGDWVLHHGEPADRERVYDMIRLSDNGITNALDAKYPNAIRETIAAYGLNSTVYPGYWGNSSTSTNDLARFLARASQDPANGRLFDGMRDMAPTTSNGYPQHYGTYGLPGVRGTKTGAASNFAVHGTASYGDGFFVAVITYGGVDAHTADARLLTPYLEKARQQPAAPERDSEPPLPTLAPVMPFLEPERAEVPWRERLATLRGEPASRGVELPALREVPFLAELPVLGDVPAATEAPAPSGQAASSDAPAPTETPSPAGAPGSGAALELPGVPRGLGALLRESALVP